jgi:transcriptional regulator with XRE-family HTH domain
VAVKQSLPLKTPGQRIKFFREYRGMSQRDLAKAVYTTQPTVARWENDEFKPTRQAQALLADVLELDRLVLFPLELDNPEAVA